MKQKRKETGLSSSKIWLNVLGVVCLVLVLWWILCLASVWLLGKSAIAAGNNSDKKLSYTWVDDTSEVVYKVSFIETENTQERELKETDFSNVYREGKNLYVTPGNVVVNRKSLWGEEISHSNKVLWDNVYWHILWWDENELSSENVTIIAWRQNIVAENNSAATVLWGQENWLLAGNGSRTAILVWWYGNHIKTSNGGVSIIWGKSNNVESNASDVVILWWEWSSVDWTSTIVWWSNVNVPNGVTDIFAFSDGIQNGWLNVSTADEWSRAFYLEVSRGLWINADPSTNWIDAWWAVGFGAIDLNDPNNIPECNSNNYGLQGTYLGCLMWCTVSGWELLDTSDQCRENVCTKIPCSEPDPCELDPNSPACHIPWRCEWNLDVGGDNQNRMHLCEGLNAAIFLDTVFERVLINSEPRDHCPNPGGWDSRFGDNQCVYQCNSDFTLTTNNVDMPEKWYIVGDVGCYQKCERNGKIIDHGQTEVWYSESSVSCAYPEDTPRSEYTCGNVKANLLCVDGDLYTMKADGKPDYKDTTHMYATCRLDGYTSCGWSYPFRASWVQGWNYPNSWSLPTSDRESATLSRWEYKLCVDFNGQETTGTNEDCSPVAPDPNHYQLVGCNSGYTRFSSATGQPDNNGDECRKNCGNEKDGTILNLYRKATPECTSTEWENCAPVTIQCFDWAWKEISSDRVAVSGEVSRSSYSTTCAVAPVCGAWENISGILGLLESAGIAWLTKVDTCYPSGTQNCTNPNKNFGGCAGDSHVEKVSYTAALWPSQTSNGINRYCIPNDKIGYCVQTGKPSGSDFVYVWTSDEIPQKWTWSSWSPSLPVCNWECSDSSKVPVLSGGSYVCVTPEKDCGWTMPSWWVETGPSKYLSGTTPTNWQDGYVSNGGALKWCQWTCKGGYKYKDKYGCELIPTPECVWEFDGAFRKNGILTSTSNVTSKLYSSESVAASHECSYYCDTYSTEPANCNNSTGECSYCKSKTKECERPYPTGNGTVLGSTSPSVDGQTWVYKSGYTQSQLWACEWSCNSGYERDGNTKKCKVIPGANQCKSPFPDGSGVLTGTWTPSVNNKAWSYKSGSAQSQLWACEWSCNSGYERDGTQNKCKVIPGTNQCNSPFPSGNGVLTGTWIPSVNNKAWSYKSGSAQNQLWACEWSCSSGYERDGTQNKCKVIPGTYQCTKKPDYAILVTWTNVWLTGDTESKLIAWNDTPASSDKCVYKCDHDNDYYYYPAWNRCEALSDICHKTEPNKCTVSWMEVKNKKQQNGKYTWECRADWEKVRDCDLGWDKPKCVYGWSRAACEWWDVYNEKWLTSGCGYEWTCGTGSNTTQCMMKYDQPVNVEYQYIMKMNDLGNDSWHRKCEELVPQSTQVILANGTMIMSTAQAANDAIGNYGVMVQNDPENNRRVWQACNYSPVNGPRYCAACIWYDVKTQYDYDESGECYIKNGSGSVVSGNYRDCDWFSAECKKIESQPRCDEKWWKLENTGQLGCSPYNNLPSGITIEEAISKMNSLKWVRSQAFGPNAGGTTTDVWNKWDSCTPGQIFCVPCAAPECYKKTGPKPIKPKCSYEPDNAIKQVWLVYSKESIKSTLVAYNYTVKDWDECIYKCDHDNNYYYYPAWNRCEALSDICHKTEPNKCTVSWATVENKKEENGKYTWDCKADWKKVGKTCEIVKAPDKVDWKCSFDGKYCSAWKVADSQTPTSWQKIWTCKGEWDWKDASCYIRWIHNGACSAAQNGHCGGGMFSDYQKYNALQCQSAAEAKWTKRSDWYGVDSAGGSAWPCTLNTSISGYSPCSNYTNGSALSPGGYYTTYEFYRCFDWKETIQCQTFENGTLENKPDSYCAWLTKPADWTSLASSYIASPGNPRQNSYVHCAASKTNANACAKVYESSTPVTDTFVGTGSDITWLATYCSNKKTESACKWVKVVQFHPANNAYQYVAPGKFVETVKSSGNNASKMSELSCCTWSN